MASVYHFFDDALHVSKDIVIKYKEYNIANKRTHYAAIKIQRLFRGYQVRKKIKNLHRAATMIQKCVRGWLLRYHLPDILQEYYDFKCMKYYNEMATRIQARWKGYQVRKYEVCIKDYLEEKELRIKADEEIKMIMSQRGPHHTGGGSLNIEDDKTYIEKLLLNLFDRHHLLKTHQQSGVLSNHGKNELSELEKFLQSIPWTGYMRSLKKIYSTYANHKEKYQYTFDDKKLRREEDLLRLREEPAIKTSLEEENIHEKPFIFATKIERKPYERLTTNEGKYTVVDTKILRSFDKSKNISDVDFKLSTLKRVASDSNVPPYYIDFWFQNCHEHNL